MTATYHYADGQEVRPGDICRDYHWTEHVVRSDTVWALAPGKTQAEQWARCSLVRRGEVRT